MNVQSPQQSQFQFQTSTPPPPPPKFSAHPSGQSTPQAGPPRPPPPGVYGEGQAVNAGYAQSAGAGQTQSLPQIGDGWLPEFVKEKNTTDLQSLLSNQDLQKSLINSPDTAHPSIPQSASHLTSLLAQNIQLATDLSTLEQNLTAQRNQTQQRLLSLRALERQWQQKQREQDEALKSFSAPALYQALGAAVAEQDSLCRGLEESFLEGQGVAGEREVTEFVRRLREAKELAYLRRERKERWDEGRVGGWR